MNNSSMEIPLYYNLHLFTISVNTLLESFPDGLHNISSAFLLKDTLKNINYFFL